MPMQVHRLNRFDLRSLSLIIPLGVVATLHAQFYVATDLGNLGGSLAYASAVNESGTVVGRASLPGDEIYHAFSFSNGSMVDLGTLGGSQSGATDINDNGVIVGSSLLRGTDISQAFIYQGGVMSSLGSSFGLGVAQGINNSGTIVGNYRLSSAGFSYRDGTVSSLRLDPTDQVSVAGVNDAGVIVGSHSVSLQEHASSFSNGAFTDLGLFDGDNFSYANRINNLGTIVGYSFFIDLSGGALPFRGHAFSYSNGAMVDLGTLGGMVSEAFSINDSGTTVGFSLVDGTTSHAFITENGQMRDLNGFVQLGDGIELSSALDINNRGQIVADGSNGHAYLLTPAGSAVPEASTFYGGVAAILAVSVKLLRRRRFLVRDPKDTGS